MRGMNFLSKMARFWKESWHVRILTNLRKRSISLSCASILSCTNTYWIQSKHKDCCIQNIMAKKMRAEYLFSSCCLTINIFAALEQTNTDTFISAITYDEFIKHIKEHKEELKPVINDQIRITKPDGTIAEFRCLLCVTMCFLKKRDELVHFLFDEFRDIINANVDYMWHIRTTKPTQEMKWIVCSNLHEMLAKHPSFDVNHAFAIWDRYLFMQEDPLLLERIIATANPANYKPLEQSAITIEIAKEYVQNPIKMHKKMNAKHFGIRKGTQIFCLCLLIDNKFLQISSWSI